MDCRTVRAKATPDIPHSSPDFPIRTVDKSPRHLIEGRGVVMAPVVSNIKS
jgi:hypothetical protein